MILSSASKIHVTYRFNIQNVLHLPRKFRQQVLCLNDHGSSSAMPEGKGVEAQVRGLGCPLWRWIRSRSWRQNGWLRRPIA